MAVGFPTKANWAAGDVLTASAQDDLAGTVNLLSNASATSGSQLVSNVAGTSFAYQATPSASNPVLNSAMQIFQRSSTPTTGITVTGGSAYTLDRWLSRTATGSGSVTTSRQVTNDTTNLPNIQYCARFQRVAANTDTGALNFANQFETINTIPFLGKTVTYSFYARAGANYSPTSSTLTFEIDTGTGTDQSVFSYTGFSVAGTSTATLTTTWKRFSANITIPTTANEMSLVFTMTPTGTAGANDYFEVTGVQVDIGSVALPFRTYAATFQGELAACQRYFLAGTTNIWSGNAVTSSVYYVTATFPVTMRTTATVTPTGLSAYGFSNTTRGVLAAYAGSVSVSATATSTVNGGYFDFTYTASAEL